MKLSWCPIKVYRVSQRYWQTLEPTEEALARKVKVVQLQLHAALQNQNAAVFQFQKYFQCIFSQFIIDFEHTE